jgi:hypothetical protein
MKPGQLEFGRLQPRLQQVQIGIDAGLGALLLDAQQIAVSLLLLRRGQLAVHSVELDVGEEASNAVCSRASLRFRLAASTPARAALLYWRCE